MTPFERDFGADPQLALRMLEDPFKAPEQKQQAAEYLLMYAARFIQ